MLIFPFFSCFSPYFLSRWVHIFIHKSLTQQIVGVVYRVPGLWPSAEGLQSWQTWCTVPGAHAGVEGSEHSAEWNVISVATGCSECSEWAIPFLSAASPTSVLLLFPSIRFMRHHFMHFYFGMCFVFLACAWPILDSASLSLSTLK